MGESFVFSLNDSTTQDTLLNYSLTSNATFNTSAFNNVSSMIPKSQGVSKFYPVIITEMVLSIICLIFTICVYSILPEFRNVHGRNLISLSSCLLISFTFLILDLLLRNRISAQFCFAIAMIIHVTFLATFFWTNVMAFDIWRTMANMKPKTDAKRSKKYFKYSIYAWTATFFTALPAAVLDQTKLVPIEYRPMFGQSRCWLSGTRAFVMYFNAPVGVILFFNLIFFLLTTRSLIIIKKITERLCVKRQQQRFYLYLKLFLAMGIIWLTEFLPLATGIYKLYALAAMLTALHGVILFAIFVCKRRILRQVLEKLDIKWHEKSTSVNQQTCSTTADSVNSVNSTKL